MTDKAVIDKAVIDKAVIDKMIEDTRTTTPPAAAHWSNRTMAAYGGLSRTTVQREWKARGLKPHLVKTFKISNDPRFEEKLIDVVGLYLNLPDNAIVPLNVASGQLIGKCFSRHRHEEFLAKVRRGRATLEAGRQPRTI